jgi:hypothetical protein
MESICYLRTRTIAFTSTASVISTASFTFLRGRHNTVEAIQQRRVARLTDSRAHLAGAHIGRDITFVTGKA